MAHQTGKVIFVFGSNLAGRHGKGSALEARAHWGAKPGVGVGPTGRAYAIPTKDGNLNILSLQTIRPHVETFLHYAAQCPELTFKVVAIGCGLAGYSPEQIAPFFRGHTPNVLLPNEFKRVLQCLPYHGDNHPGEVG